MGCEPEAEAEADEADWRRKLVMAFRGPSIVPDGEGRGIASESEIPPLPAAPREGKGAKAGWAVEDVFALLLRHGSAGSRSEEKGCGFFPSDCSPTKKAPGRRKDVYERAEDGSCERSAAAATFKSVEMEVAGASWLRCEVCGAGDGLRGASPT